MLQRLLVGPGVKELSCIEIGLGGIQGKKVARDAVKDEKEMRMEVLFGIGVHKKNERTEKKFKGERNNGK